MCQRRYLRGAAALASISLLITLWCLTHHYLGLAGDARLYGVQALARIRPNLLADLYLRNTSQDSYTIFSSIYAICIEQLGLREAALWLTIIFKAWLFGAAWVLARRLSDRSGAFLALILIIVIPGEYGAFGVFHYAEDWVTARSLAEALSLTALACWCHERRLWGLILVCAAMFVHPLLALPVVLVMICLALSFRLSVIGAGIGILALLIISLIAVRRPIDTHIFAVMDAGWLEVVRERSQFLFLQLWRPRDWCLNARPFVSLSLSLLVLGDERARRLCTACMLVGGSGLAIALVASLVGPVGLFLQGQAWRWIWIGGFMSMVLMAPTILTMWHKKNALCCLLMLSGWTFSTISGTASLLAALVLWLVRDRIHPAAARLLSLIAAISGLVLMAWGVKAVWTAAPLGLIGEPAMLHRSPTLELTYIAMAVALGYALREARFAKALPLAASLLVATSVYCLPKAIHEPDRKGATAQFARFSTWRRAIPPTANVLVEPVGNSAGFAWFTLERPSYLSVDQSSGVVFSRATALEVRRRSEVLLPIMSPDWMLLSSLSGARSGSSGGREDAIRPLTKERLSSICTDPQLNFVIASTDVGVESLKQPSPEGRGDWYLYDCRLVDDRLTPAGG